MGVVSLSAVTENRKEFITQITNSVFSKMFQVNVVCDNAHMRFAIWHKRSMCVWCTLCLCKEFKPASAILQLWAVTEASPSQS